MNWIQKRKFLLLFLALIQLIAIYPLFHELLSTRLIYNVLQTVVLLGVCYVIFTQPLLRWSVLLVGLPVSLGTWSNYTVPGIPRFEFEIVLHCIAAAYLGLTVILILRLINREQNVTMDSVYGAFCGYLLVGIAFGHIYCVIETVRPASFRASAEIMDQLQDEGHRHFVLTYFSFITLTTVGYGEIRPATAPARGMAIVEAIMGQFYIAVLIAEVIGKRASQSTTPEPPPPK